ncbi:hypothetical protein D5086_016117 [Populus alba]|uniref:Uncharacterized protein n=1 Tax=Populus alba TaxID=43335 RepID=A0ACC4BTQ6_POPAL
MDRAIACYAEAGPGPGASKERGTHRRQMPPCTFPLCLRVRWQSQTWLINGVASYRLSTSIAIYALRIDMLPNCCVWSINPKNVIFQSDGASGQRKGRELQDACTFCCENEQSCRSPKLYRKKRRTGTISPKSDENGKRDREDRDTSSVGFSYSLRESYYSSLVRPLFESNDPRQNLMRDCICTENDGEYRIPLAIVITGRLG